MRHLKSVRKAVGGLFLLLFIVGPVLVAFRVGPQGISRKLMELDPLVAVGTAVATGVVYAGLWLAAVLLVLTLVFGRFFCSWVCPLGVSQDAASVSPRDKRPSAQRNRNRYRNAYHLKYGILVALLVLAVLGPVQLGLLDPLALFLRSVGGVLVPGLQHSGAPIGVLARVTAGGVLFGAIFVGILAATRWIPRAWCRGVCPLGAMLGVASRWSLFQIRRDPEKCTDCGLCQRVCNGAADPHSKLRPSECICCFNCVGVCPEGALTYGLPGKRSLVSESSPDVTRRRALAAAGAGLVAFPLLRVATSSANVPDPKLIRPPGSLPEEEFLSRCVKCGACIQVCPTNGLQPAMGEGGFEALWSPVLVPRIGHCEAMCTRCGHQCPTGAIRPLTEADRSGREGKEQVRIGTAFVDRGRCLPWAMGRPCLVCEEMCPASPKAIWAEEFESTKPSGGKEMLQRPRVIPARCIGCGACESHCPVAGKKAIRVTSVGESRSRKNRFLLSSSSGREPRRDE
jgi:MauM/NapG family ferredoxin protein